MIDTHCHLLPGLDDGPADLAASVALARALVDQGISRVVATPHVSRRWRPRPSVIVSAYAAVVRALKDLGIPLVVDTGAEISPGEVITRSDDNLRELAIRGRFLLVEATDEVSAHALVAVVDRVRAAGLVPIVGHPERCRALQRRPAAVDEVARAGALLQVVSPSLAGRWGEPCAAAAWWLVETGRADLVASDAHGAERRRPRLLECARLVERRVSLSASRRLFESGPLAVVTDPGSDLQLAG